MNDNEKVAVSPSRSLIGSASPLSLENLLSLSFKELWRQAKSAKKANNIVAYIQIRTAIARKRDLSETG